MAHLAQRRPVLGENLRPAAVEIDPAVPVGEHTAGFIQGHQLRIAYVHRGRRGEGRTNL